MITGYNTDVEHDGVVYHVQTEDKGLENPLLLSLVYAGGAILASKRSSYEDLIVAGFNEAALAERLQRQHRLICAAINAGRIGDLKKMSPQSRTGPLTMPPGMTPPPVEPSLPGEVQPAGSPALDDFIIEIGAGQQSWEPVPDPISEPDPPEPEFEVTQPIAPAPPSAYTVYDSRRQSDTPRVEEGLHIVLTGEKDYRGGDEVAMEITVTHVSAQGEKPVAAVVSVKILGTAFRPVILSLRTNKQGSVPINTHIPVFNTGRAAIVIKATAAGQTIETRRVIHPS
jgi:hypothetical protein